MFKGEPEWLLHHEHLPHLNNQPLWIFGDVFLRVYAVLDQDITCVSEYHKQYQSPKTYTPKTSLMENTYLKCLSTSCYNILSIKANDKATFAISPSDYM